MFIPVGKTHVYMPHGHSHGCHQWSEKDDKILLTILIVSVIFFIIGATISTIGYIRKTDSYNDGWWEYFFSNKNLMIAILNWLSFAVLLTYCIGYIGYFIYNLL